MVSVRRSRKYCPSPNKLKFGEDHHEELVNDILQTLGGEAAHFVKKYGWRGYKKETKPDFLPLFEPEEWSLRRSGTLAEQPGVRATQTLHVSSPTVAPPPKDPMCETTPPHAQCLEPLDLIRCSQGFYQKSTLQCWVRFSARLPCCTYSALRSAMPPTDQSRVRLHGDAVKPLSVKSFSVKPRCVRQLFRNLSPELNTGPAPKVPPPTTPRREGLRSCRSHI
ncbi:hypothetical protein WMY93_026139 [Mugilogobius chulae]|uniref:Uncharacterized protein n=1 Tax=Mugilogobius chulae TaxID=88201 RepID=A0AAW0N7K4_9GOBI